MKRKQGSASGESKPVPPPSLSSLDAALDLLACETFGRLQALTAKFESAAAVKLNDGVVKHRWEEACMRYWLMKSMDDLTCSTGALKANGDSHDGMTMDDDDRVANGNEHASDRYERPMPQSCHPGAVITFGLDTDDTAQWRRWTPKLNDLVVVELSNGEIWPGKIINKQACFQGRSVPRGNHFYAVRVYSDSMEPTVTVKARLVPFALRSTPPLMASTALLSAYNHANDPTSFDALALHREAAAATARTHPGVGDEFNMAKIQAEKEEWKAFVNWLMDERRVEKLRVVCEERDRRLREVTKTEPVDDWDDYEVESLQPRKRRVTPSIPPFSYAPINKKKTVQKVEGDPNERGGIFRITALKSASASPANSTPGPTASSSKSVTPMSSYIRPPLSVPYRSGSPRRADRRRNGLFAAMGEFSPRGRGGTYTPPRVLPNGDETAVFGSPSPAPSLKSFDFISPLGAVKRGKLAIDMDDDTVMQPRNSLSGNLEAVQEEGEEDDGVPAWTLVSKRRTKRAGSAPVENVDKVERMTKAVSSDDLVL